MRGKESLNERVGTGRIVKERNGRKKSTELNLKKKKKKTDGNSMTTSKNQTVPTHSEPLSQCLGEELLLGVRTLSYLGHEENRSPR